MGETIKPEVGVTVHKDGATFRVWAPFASSVAVTGSFNDWSQDANPLSKSDNGMWWAYVAGVIPGQEYKFIIRNGEHVLFKNDPRSLQLTPAGDNSIIADPTFDWDNDNFQIGPTNELIIYELHIGTFNRPDESTSGTFETAVERLDHLADLGINTINLMPSANMWMNRGWGYAPNYIYAVEASYGGKHGFMTFVKAAHARGIAVILDVVYNHFGPGDIDIWQFDGWQENNKGGIYFYNDWRCSTPWGETRPDYGRPQVRSYITDNVNLWMSECHVDGLRVDSTHFIRNVKGNNNDPSNDIPEGWQVLQEITAKASQITPGALMIAEDLASNEYISKPVSEGGAGFGAQWDTSFPYALRDVLEPIRDSDRNLELVEKAIIKNFNSDAFQRVIYSESHDADANGRSRLNEEIAPGAADNIFARRRSTLAAAIVLTSPGIPMLFQGQEIMEYGYFNHWQALDWGRIKEFHEIVKLYKDLIALRRNSDQITRGLMGQSYQTLHLDEQTKVLGYHRWDQGGPRDDVVIVANFSNEQRNNYEIKFPQSGTWKARFNSDWQGYSPDFGNTDTPDVQVVKNSGAVNLGPYSVVILSQD